MQKKVVMFVPEFPVLSETFIERDVDAMARSRQIDVQVVAIKQGSGFRSKRAEKATVYRRLTPKVFFQSLSFFVMRPLKVMNAFRVLGLTRFYSFLKSLGYAKIFSDYSPDYIYGQFLSSPSTVALGAAIILDVPLAISAHARDVLEYPDLVKQKVKHSKFITFCNRNAMEKAKELAGNVPTDNLKLIYHGVDITQLVPKRGVIEKPGSNFVFSVGRLTEKKGLKYLIGASEILRDRGVDHTIFVAGGGPLFNELDAEVDKLDLEDRFVLLGSTPFEDIVEYYNLADVYAQPAIVTENGDSDGVPNTLIEAAMLKIPIVTTHAGGISEFLDEESSVIVKQHHSEGLANGIQKLLEDKELGDRLSNVAFSKAQELFNLEQNMQKIEELFLLYK